MLQGQYWSRPEPYNFVPVSAFSEAYWHSSTGKGVAEYLKQASDRAERHPALLSTKKYSLPQLKILRACLRREITLMSRNRWSPLWHSDLAT
jgi:hypothetical protein